MATEKIKIESISFKNNWFNLKDIKGREISVATVDKEQKAVNPKLKAILSEAKEGDEVEMDLREWQGKWFANDPKAAGAGKTFQSKDKSFEAAQSAAIAVGNIFAGKAETMTPKAFDTLFEHVYKSIMSKITK